MTHPLQEILASGFISVTRNKTRVLNSENTIFFFFSINKCALDFTFNTHTCMHAHAHTHTHLQASTYISVYLKTQKFVQILAYAVKILYCGNKYEKLSCKIPFQHFFCPWFLVDQVLLHYNLLFIHSVAVYFAHCEEY